MTKEEYLKTQMVIIKITEAVSGLDLETFLEMLSTANTSIAAIEPKIAPQISANVQNNLNAIKLLVEALIPVKKAHEYLFQTVLKTANKGHMEMKPPTKEEI